MKLMTDSGSFGVQLARVRLTEFFRIRLFLGDAVLGEYEPAIIWQDLHALSGLANIADTRLDPFQPSAPWAIREAFLSDEQLQDSCIVQLGESFDRWLVRGYFYGDQVVVLHAQTSGLHSADFTLTLVAADEYRHLVRTASTFYDTSMD